MNSNQIQNIEYTKNNTIMNNSTVITNSKNFIPSFPINNNSSTNKKVIETNQFLDNYFGSKKIQEIEEKKYINSIPFKSLMELDGVSDEEKKGAFSSKYLSKQNQLFNGYSQNPFELNINLELNKIVESNIQNKINDKKDIEENNRIEKYFKTIVKSQNPRYTINAFPKENNSFGRERVFKIRVFTKSKEKQCGRISTIDNSFCQNNSLNPSNINEEKEIYKTLIKRIALQLKTKKNPKTHGFFYKYIKSIEYIKLIKRIALQIKMKRRQQTQGFFYKYIKNIEYILLVKKIAFLLKKRIKEPTHGFYYNRFKKEEYLLLIKRIASQLKKRIFLPKCKIIKIYEPYLILIKKIAAQLNINRKKTIISKTTLTNLF